MFPFIPNEDCHLRATQHVHNVSLAGDQASVENFIRRDLSRELAKELVATRMKTLPGDYSTEYRMDLYVFTPDEFARVVQEAAMHLSRAMRGPPPIIRES